jgi:hypothetical protein
LGYTDWNAYLASLDLRAVVESDLFCGEGICASDLSEGDRVQVEWLPNRRCVFRFLGENQFVVQESLRSKLSVDDTFETAAFIVGKPLYVLISFDPDKSLFNGKIRWNRILKDANTGF